MSKFIDPELFDELKRGKHLPTASGTRQNIMQLCTQGDVNLFELAQLVRSDPLLSGRLIHLANNASKGRRRPIAGVSPDVLLLVGFQTIRQLSLALSIASTQTTISCSHFDLKKFWARAFAMASTAQCIASFSHVAPAAEMFTTGLLANVGRLGLASARPEVYSTLLSRELPIKTQLAMEQSLFGFNHLDLAAAMMQDWNIPTLFCDAVIHHETPEMASFEKGSRRENLLVTLHLASLSSDIATSKNLKAKLAVEDLAEIAKSIGLDSNAWMEIWRASEMDWKDWGIAMHLPANSYAS